MKPPLSLFYLYRQRIPAAAPQSVQILSTAHALAVAGARVCVMADRPLPNRGADLNIGAGTEAQVLEAYGLTSHPNLSLKWLPEGGSTRSGLAYRMAAWSWLKEARRQGHRPVFYSRRADYAVSSWVRACVKAGWAKLAHEWHYVASVNALEAGDFGRAGKLRRQEQEVLATAHAQLLINADIQSWLLRGEAPDSSSMELQVSELKGIWAVIPNGGPEPLAEVYPWTRTQPVRLVYSSLFRRTQDLNLLWDALRHLPESIGVDLFGGEEDGLRVQALKSALMERGLSHRVTWHGAHSPAETRRRLIALSQEARLIGLALFADSINMLSFASPLKVFEYHALGIPVLATEHPSTRKILGGAPQNRVPGGLLVPPDEPRALARAVMTLSEDLALVEELRALGLERAKSATWQQRGERILSVLERL